MKYANEITNDVIYSTQYYIVLYIFSELQFYISFNILLDNEVMETSKRRSFLPLVFIIQYYIEYINRSILAKLQCKSLKLGRLIVVQETHLSL